MGVSSCDVIAGEGVGLHNGRCLETMDFVDFLLCCMQSTQNCVAKALVPVLNAPENERLADAQDWKSPPQRSQYAPHQLVVAYRSFCRLVED